MPPPAKRRKTHSKVEEISFDSSARQEFLTGFHKRKVQRAKHAQEAAERKAREERIAERKKIRDERKADLERHVKEVNALIRPADASENEDNDMEEEGDGSDGGDWEGIEEAQVPPVDHEAEYIDEDKYTTVTVEAIDATRDGLAKLGEDTDNESEENEGAVQAKTIKYSTKVKRVKNAAEKQRSEQKKVNKRKKKNFRYESKGDRKVARTKEKMKNSKQAKARKAG